VAGVGGGTVGVAGSVGVTVLTVHTWASTGLGVTLKAGGDILVGASDDTRLLLIQASLAVGYVGVGAAVGVAVLNKDVQAFIGAGSNVTAGGNGAGLTGIRNGNISGSGFANLGGFHGLAVQADSSEDIFGLAASVGGGFVGVAGGLNVTIINVTVKALIGSGTVNGSLAGANPLQSVNVAATDRAKTLTIAGGAGGGFVGAGGGVDIGILNVTVQGAILGGLVQANDDVAVYGLSTKDVQTYAISLGVGAVGVAGSVSVWSVGATPTTTYEESPEGENRGAWDGQTTYVAGDKVTYLGKTYAAKDDVEWTGGPDNPNPQTDTANWIENDVDPLTTDAKTGPAPAWATNNTSPARTYPVAPPTRTRPATVSGGARTVEATRQPTPTR
jgi:hypothetical protein